MDLIKQAKKIPFSDREFFNCFEKIYKERLKKIENILSVIQDIPFEFEGCSYVCVNNDNNFYIFDQLVKSESKFEKDMHIPTADQVKPIYNYLYNKYPEEYPDNYGHPNYHKKRLIGGYYADESKKNVYMEHDSEWESLELTSELEKEYSFLPITVSILGEKKSIKSLLLCLLQRGLKPIIPGIIKEDFDFLSAFSNCLSIENNDFHLDFGGVSKSEDPQRYKDVYRVLLQQMGLLIDNLTKEQIEKYLLECEKIRCDMEPYSPKILSGTDAESQLWNFWADDYNDVFGIPLPDGMDIKARNPLDDISDDDAIGIDFGTTSTVVIKTDDHNTPKPISVGPGTGKEDYENPTLIKVIDLNSFLERYSMKEGRPNTEWKDLWVAHPVKRAFSGETLKEEDVSSILYQIKQWAANSDKIKTIIKPSNENRLVQLKALSDLVDNEEFNPIEIYAYFIGLYLNNRRYGHKIYQNYHLTYPATFDSNIREYIRKSFEKGLRKSIPEPVLKSEKFNLSVKMDFSEPEAYAACALEEFNFEPKENEPVKYAIFDFGGGTSDFAYGYWSIPTNSNYDFKLDNIRTDGKEFLGGENILEGLAFKVFSDENNLKVLKKNNCHFHEGLLTKNNYSTSIIPYLSEGQPAKKNMRELVEQLRLYWEKAEEKDRLGMFLNTASDSAREPEEYGVETTDEMSVNLILRSDDNKDYSEILYYSREKIFNYFSDRITEGVDSFFSALEDCFFKEGESNQVINILLAGNSSRSPIFQNIIRRKAMALGEKLDVEFRIFSPLGSDSCWGEMSELLEKQGWDKNEIQEHINEKKKKAEDGDKPTGKTGVAFGVHLLAGQSIEITHQTVNKFAYYLGIDKYKKGSHRFEVKNLKGNGGLPKIGTWYEFFDVIRGKTQYCIKYTTDSYCLTGKMEASNANTVFLNVPEPNDGDKIFIKAIGSKQLVWTIAQNESEADGKARENNPDKDNNPDNVFYINL